MDARAEAPRSMQRRAEAALSEYLHFIYRFLILILYDYARRAPFQAPSANVTATRVKEEGPWKKLGHQEIGRAHV